ncbi:MAG TPA: transposase [Steroidobacteraceae bacterium]|nr:transposase [Steroidobacteraceae bacterium]
MSSQRIAPEFKDEAVRQFVERGDPVSEVAQRLGVSAHSLYKWVKAVKPNMTEQHASEPTGMAEGLLTAKAPPLPAVRRHW